MNQIYHDLKQNSGFYHHQMTSVILEFVSYEIFYCVLSYEILVDIQKCRHFFGSKECVAEEFF